MTNAQIRLFEVSTRGLGQLTQAVVRSAEKEKRDPTPVVVALASIRPNEGVSTMDLFGALLVELSQTGRVSRGLGGQAFLIRGEGFEGIIAPVAVEPELLVLLATGATAAPVRSVTRQLLASLSSP